MAAPRWRRRKDDRPAEILAAALESFAERGFAQTRLDEVAAKAGVSKGTLYLYFPSKQALFEGVVRAALLPNLAQAEQLLASSEASATALLTQIMAMLGRAIGTTRLGAIPKLVLAESGNFPDLARFYLETVVRRGFRLIGRIIRRGIASGEFRPLDVDTACRAVMAPVLFAALWKNSLEPFDGQSLDAEAHCRASAEILIQGFRARPAGGPVDGMA
jgi:AcrR family transcriptional regulator